MNSGTSLAPPVRNSQRLRTAPPEGFALARPLCPERKNEQTEFGPNTRPLIRKGQCSRHRRVWRPGSYNIDLLVNEPCHCFGSRRRHRKWPVPSKVRISTCATYNLPPSRGWGSGKLAFLMNNDNSIWCYQCNHAMSSRTILIRAHVHC